MKNSLMTAVLVCGLFTNTAQCDAVEPANTAKTGEFQLISTMAEVAGAEAAGVTAAVVPPDKPITWEVYVPDNYRPEIPTGLMVYISPMPSGKIPPRWKSVMGKRNMIWIAARHSGNRVLVVRRGIYALVAPALAGKYYTIDPDRIYLSGLSGGGRVASKLATDYPQVFKGAIYNSGADFWDEGTSKPLDLIKQNHYVFITGTKDFALRPTKKAHQQYLRAGVENSKLMIIRGMPHKNPTGIDFNTAIEYLDEHISTKN